MENKDWYNNFITFEDGVYTVWDESQAYGVGTTQYYDCAVAMLEAYAKLLDKWESENV